MNTRKNNHSSRRTGKAVSHSNQNGVVLFIALIVLIAMSLAGISMMRAADTGTKVAGNLAFRQSASHAADPAGEDSMPKIVSVVDSGTVPSAGYSKFDVVQKVSDRNWAAAQSLPADPATGNSVKYLVDRLCTAGGAGSESCQVTLRLIENMPGSDRGNPNSTNMARLQHFRTIVQVTDPKGQASYFEFKSE